MLVTNKAIWHFILRIQFHNCLPQELSLTVTRKLNRVKYFTKRSHELEHTVNFIKENLEMKISIKNPRF